MNPHSPAPHRLTCLAAALFLAGFSPTAESAGPAAPNAEPVKLIAQLGDADPAVRHKAAWRLREIGIPALPALRDVADSDDPEVRGAARAAIKAIGVPLPQETAGPHSQRVIQADEEHWAVEYREGRRTVVVEGDVRKQGQPYTHLKLTFTGPVDGKETTQVFSAENEERLKWDSPQAWMYFHRIYNHDSDKAAVHVPNTALKSAVNAAMDQRNFTAGERKEVADRLKRFSDACSKALAAKMFEPDEAAQAMADEFHESDSLRKLLIAKQLPIVEGPYEMDSPPEGRLGIEFATDRKEFPDGVQSGILIKFVANGERAARIGVQADDVILSVDGKPVETQEQLISACRASPSRMTIAVYRNDGKVILHEKAQGLGLGAVKE